MTFIGIAIFTIYTHTTVYSGACDPLFSSKRVCAGYETWKEEEVGTLHAVYVGEFRSKDTCSAAVERARYKPKKGERVGDLTEILCVPKAHR